MNEMSAHLAKQPPSRERPVVVHGPLFEALNASNRVVDFKNARLPISALKEWVYMLRRHREASGARTDTIDCMASDKTTGDLRAAFLDECRKKFGPPNNSLDPVDRLFEFNYSHPVKHLLVDIPEAGCRLALISSDQDFFDGCNQPDNELWLMDWSDLSGWPPTTEHPERHLIVTGFSGFCP